MKEWGEERVKGEPKALDVQGKVNFNFCFFMKFQKRNLNKINIYYFSIRQNTAKNEKEMETTESAETET